MCQLFVLFNRRQSFDALSSPNQHVFPNLNFIYYIGGVRIGCPVILQSDRKVIIQTFGWIVSEEAATFTTFSVLT